MQTAAIARFWLEVGVRQSGYRAVGVVGALWGCYLLCGCRDPACGRPFGVRLNAEGVSSEMTQRVGYFVRIEF